MAEPVRSQGSLPKRWKRRQHAERQARLLRSLDPNPVRYLPAPLHFDAPEAGALTVTHDATASRGHRITELLRDSIRRGPEGTFAPVRRPGRCSICSAFLPAGATAWWNPIARWLTCTTCVPLRS